MIATSWDYHRGAEGWILLCGNPVRFNNDTQFKKYDNRIWVYVSRDFSLKKIGNSIISQIPMEGLKQSRDTLQAINLCLGNQLHGKKVLIVLDDLWEQRDNELRNLKCMFQVGK